MSTWSHCLTSITTMDKAIAVRLPEEFREAIAREQDEVEKKAGYRPTVSEVVKQALRKGLRIKASTKKQ